MAYATDADRKALKESNSSFDACPMVLRFDHNGRQNELVMDDVDQALANQKSWIDKGADYVEIFRVNDDGTLKATIGAYRKGE